MLLGRTVTLETSDEDRDKYGRLLRYVIVDGVDVGARHRNSPAGEADDAVRDLCRSLDGLPLAIELAVGTHEDLVDRRDRPPPRRPVPVLQPPTSRRPERAPRIEGDDRMELRAALSRRPKRRAWALPLRGWSPAPRRRVAYSRRSTCPRPPRSTLSGRLASRSLVIVDDEGPVVRYRLLDSIRAYARDAMAETGRPSERAQLTLRGSLTPPTRPPGRSQQPPSRAPVLRSRRALQHRRCPDLERDARPAARDPDRQRVRLGVDRPRRQQWCTAASCARSMPLARRRRISDRAERSSARGVARGFDRPTSSSPAKPHHRGAADWRTRSTTSTCRHAAATTSPTSSRTTASTGQAMELTDRSNALYRRARPTVGSGRELALRRPGRHLGRRPIACRRSLRSGRALAAKRRRSVAARPPRGDSRASLLVSSIGSMMRSCISVAPPKTSGRLGFRQTEAYQLSSLGRAQCQAGDYTTRCCHARARSRKG